MTDLELNEIKDQIKDLAPQVIGKYGYEFLSESIRQPRSNDPLHSQVVEVNFLNQKNKLRVDIECYIGLVPHPVRKILIVSFAC
jgi:hypothetical protein